MPVPNYVWPAIDEFIDRVDETAAIEKWWSSSDKMPLSLYGRRRCGKSWLFRKVAHGKPAVILVARKASRGAQLRDFAEKFEPVLGVRPSIDSLADLFRVIYRAAREQKILFVIDEFPYLLPTTKQGVEQELTAIAAVMEEERDGSLAKILISGSLVGQMESLLAEKGALYGRLRPLQLQPVAFPEARLFLPSLDPIKQFERFSIAGGMPRYLSVLGGSSSLSDVLVDRVLDTNSALWNEVPTVLEQELREPKTYFSILQALSSGDKENEEIAVALRIDPHSTSKYLGVLEEMRLIERITPIGAAVTSRNSHWHLSDPFFRFWFRFVFPFQDDLESGLSGESLFANEIAPVINDHVGPEFEKYCRYWIRSTQKVSQVGSWWGPALHALRKTKERMNEEIDAVGTSRGRVVLVGEARWRNAAMDLAYLKDIETHKIPALRQSSLKVAESPTIFLFSRGGYSKGLAEAAADRDDVVLVDVVGSLS